MDIIYEYEIFAFGYKRIYSIERDTELNTSSGVVIVSGSEKGSSDDCYYDGNFCTIIPLHQIQFIKLKIKDKNTGLYIEEEEQ